MAKILDLNKVKRPTLPIILLDAKQTRIDVTTPTESMVQEFISTASELEAVVKAGDREGVAAIYDVTARLLSFNRQGITMTGEELREKYGVDMEVLTVLINAYTDFITEVASAKN